MEEGLSSEPPNAGAILDCLEALLEDDGDNPKLPELFDSAQNSFSSNYIVLQKIINLQEKAAKGNPEEIKRLRRERIGAIIAYANGQPGGTRMGILKDAARLATQYGFPELVTKTTTMMQQIPDEELELTTLRVHGSVPCEVIKGVISGIVNQDWFADVLRVMVSTRFPTGDLETNTRAVQNIAKQAPFAFQTARILVDQEGLPVYTSSSEEDVVDQQFVRLEVIFIQSWGEILATALQQSLTQSGKLTNTHS